MLFFWTCCSLRSPTPLQQNFGYCGTSFFLLFFPFTLKECKGCVLPILPHPPDVPSCRMLPAAAASEAQKRRAAVPLCAQCAALCPAALRSPRRQGALLPPRVPGDGMAEPLWSAEAGGGVYRSRDPVRNLRLR